MTEALPIRLEVDYTSRHGRWSALFRLVLVLPPAVLLAMFVAPQWSRPDSPIEFIAFFFGGAIFPGFLLVLWFATAWMVTFRRRYPRWLFQAHAEIVRFGIRVVTYVFLLTDTYPSVDEETDVRVLMTTPPVQCENSRRIAFMKWAFLAPHYLVLYLYVAWAIVVVMIAWLLLILGRPYPRSLFAFVAGTLGYALRVYAYAFLHLTDDYPQFGLTSPVAEIIDPPS